MRMPATYAATRRVFEEARRLAPDFGIRSMLDLGAGPGTAAWAAVEAFPELDRVVLIERDEALIDAGRRLARSAAHATLVSGEWRRADLASARNLPPENIGPGVISYGLGELSAAALTNV